MNYYNEIDPFCCRWLKNLMDAGLIPPGDIDNRSIIDVRPDDLDGYTQHHFFAGIGGWSYALRLAGWPDDRPVTTASCPCQPFSIAGKGEGTNDERHLWPAFRWLVGQRRFSIIFGEQVASKAGREWLAGVRDDMETMGYEVGAADLCAASVGTPQNRPRLWWVADTWRVESRKGGIARSKKSSWSERGARPCVGSESGSVGDTMQQGLATVRQEQAGLSSSSYWKESRAIECGDGITRRIEPSIAPLVDGIPGRVGRLRGYGNAIVPQVAAEFIQAYMEALA